MSLLKKSGDVIKIAKTSTNWDWRIRIRISDRSRTCKAKVTTKTIITHSTPASSQLNLAHVVKTEIMSGKN